MVDEARETYREPDESKVLYKKKGNGEKRKENKSLANFVRGVEDIRLLDWLKV